MTPRILSMIATELEATAGASTVANASETGYWKRVAAAAETITGFTSTAAPDRAGFMRRTALAFESDAGSSYSQNIGEEAWIARIVMALETINGVTTVGSWSWRFYLAVVGGGGSANGTITLTITTPPYENMSVGTTIGTLAVAGHPSGPTGWTFAETTDPDGKFAIVGTALNLAAALDYETKTSHTYTITASKAAQPPIVKTLTINVLNTLEVTLGALALSATSFVIGTPSSGAITGASAVAPQSTLLGIGLPDGLTINSAARTWSWSGVGTGSTGTFALRETHVDGNNSPRTTSGLAYAITSPSSTVVSWAANFDDNTLVEITGGGKTVTFPNSGAENPCRSDVGVTTDWVASYTTPILGSAALVGLCDSSCVPYDQGRHLWFASSNYNDLTGGSYNPAASAAWTTTDRVDIACKRSINRAWFGKNGTWYNGDPVAGTGGIDISVLVGSIYLFAAGRNVTSVIMDPAHTGLATPAGFVDFGV